MSNPDRSVSSFSVSLPVGILFLAVLIVLFQFKKNIPLFHLVLWIGIPVLAFIVVFCVNLITQYSNCGSINIGKAALGALPSVGTILIGLCISSNAICRIPVASVFTPLIGNSIDITRNVNSLKNVKSKECCNQKVSIYTAESNEPIIQGISYGFYSMFAAFFGIAIGNGYDTIC